MFTQELADRICAQLAEGKSLRAVCAADDMPGATTVRDWLEQPDKKEFAAQYAAARARGYQALADEIIDISDESANDVIVDENGRERVDGERVARSKLRVDSRKWLLSKMLPKVYGDKIEQTVQGPNGGPVEMSLAVQFVKSGADGTTS